MLCEIATRAVTYDEVGGMRFVAEILGDDAFDKASPFAWFLVGPSLCDTVGSGSRAVFSIMRYP